jgi:hypothetical protein
MAASTSSTATRTPAPRARVGTSAWAKALTYFNGSAV